MKNKPCNNAIVNVQILLALANIAIFGTAFMVMNYFELMGADPAYFDEGTINNIKNINSVLALAGMHIDPTAPHKISTVHYALCLGIAFALSGVTIMFANRRSNEIYEVTEAKQ